MSRVLIIDDDTDLLIAVKAILKLKGYDAFTTNNPSALEAIIQTTSPDVILMDVNLDKEDGRKLCRQLKLNEAFKNIPVILFSADHSVEKTISMYGADAFIEKPFEAKHLFNTIDTLVNLHHQPLAKTA